MYIEDLIERLGPFSVSINSYDQSVIDSFRSQIQMGIGMTEKQSQLAIKLIKRYRHDLENYAGVASGTVQGIIDSPQFKLATRQLVPTRTIKIITDNDRQKFIEARFPYDENALTKIRNFKSSSKIRRWDKESSAWIFDLSEEHIKFLIELFDQNQFEYDEEFQKYVEQYNLIISNIEKYAPMLAEDHTIKNSPKYMPKINGTDIIESVFQARRMGVTLWDDSIDQYLKSDQINPIIQKFLYKDVTQEIELGKGPKDLQCLEMIIKHLGPTLFVIPGGSELEKTNLSYDILRGMGLENKNISVLFRLPNETGKNFNEFVKNHQLNTPISEETLAVFVSNKLPKTVAKSEIRFNSIVNLGFDSAHYTLKEFMKNHQNSVLLNTQKESFA
jgi:hypothetical protein